MSGIADFATVAGSPRASLVFVSRAQSPLVDPNALDWVVVRSSDAAATLAMLRSTFTESPTLVVTAGEDYVAELQRDASRQTSFISSFLTFFAVIALIAGTTIIYNTFVLLHSNPPSCRCWEDECLKPGLGKSVLLAAPSAGKNCGATSTCSPPAGSAHYRPSVDDVCRHAA